MMNYLQMFRKIDKSPDTKFVTIKSGLPSLFRSTTSDSICLAVATEPHIFNLNSPDCHRRADARLIAMWQSLSVPIMSFVRAYTILDTAVVQPAAASMPVVTISSSASISTARRWCMKTTDAVDKSRYEAQLQSR